MEIKHQVSLAQFSTIRVGGKAEYFTEVRTREEFLEAVTWAREKNLKIRLLGNGSNTLIAAPQISGLVIRNLTSEIKILEGVAKRPKITVLPRFQPVELDPQLTALTYEQSAYPLVAVSLDSGVYLPKAIFSLINQGITGLEWFAGIPATVGGATYINLHGADKYWSDYLATVEIINSQGEIEILPLQSLAYDYDSSRFIPNREIILRVTLNLYRGPQEQALQIAKYWQSKKSHQPQRSLGCIFQNLSATEQTRLDLPTPSIGYLLDKKLNLKGRRIGQAQLSWRHAGFIENLGGATAEDVLGLIELVQHEAKIKLGLNLKLEIVLWRD